jgi:hypothetical protein
MEARWRWAALVAVVLATRLAHGGVLWVEESYPAAAAVQILQGKVPYRDFFFDKPPLAPLFYAAWGAAPGAPARIAGAAYVTLCAWLAYELARRFWWDRAGWIAATLIAFFLTFYVPAAVIPLAPDLLMVAPHLASMLALSSGRPLVAGALAAAALAVHTKGVIVLVILLAWQPGAAAAVLAGFAAGTALVWIPLALVGAWNGYWQQVWVWGTAYAADPPATSSFTDGTWRTLNWLGFHAAAAIGAMLAFRRNWKLAVWLALALAGALLGARFAPRYYLLPLGPLVIASAGPLSGGRSALALLLLLIPLVRFGPRFVQLATHRSADWSDLAMFRDGEEASGIIERHARPGSTILIWGYRPEILWRTRLPLGAPFLDSQPLTGVLADRHLTVSKATLPDVAEANRKTLAASKPDFVIDGLGPYNPKLSITAFPDLSAWLADYEVLASTGRSVIYRRASRAVP